MKRATVANSPLFFAGSLICLLFLLSFPAHAATRSGLVVTPLMEGEPAPNTAQPNLGSPGTTMPGANPGTAPLGSTPANPSGMQTPNLTGSQLSGSGAPPPVTDLTPSKDVLVMAYLIELMRKQNKPCPSGIMPPTPPSLLLSEPLCRVAEAVGRGVTVQASAEEQGIFATHWRLFNAAEQPAQVVANRLRAEHCEALHEPYTHIGAWHGPEGWRIVMATLTEKPQPDIQPALQPDAQAADPGTNSATPATPAAGVAAAGAAAPVATGPATPSGAEERAPGQEARAMFILINELRSTGGSCLGQPQQKAPSLRFDQSLQATAEMEASQAAQSGSFLTGASPGAQAQVPAPDNATQTRLTAVSRTPASAVLDTWMVNPSRCNSLLDSAYGSVGAAYVDGYWVVIMGK